MIVLPLAGSCEVSCDDQPFALLGRESVFAAVTDFCYAPRGCRVELFSERGGRFAFPSARASRQLPARYGPAADVAVELRGAGSASRQVNNFCSPESFEADRLIAVEVLTPGGNWSSYPPHKHDEQREDESALEEIYYFEVSGDGPAYQRVYGSGPGRRLSCAPRCALVTRCSSRTVTTGHPWRRRGTTSITSTSWRGPESGYGASATTPLTPGYAAAGTAWPSMAGFR